jgi:predicted dehydrogenase
MKNKISIGLIGYGNIGKKRLEALNQMRKIADVKVICDKFKIRKRFSSIEIINKLKKIHDFKLDLIIICTPTYVSKKIYTKFVGRYHLLIEKPITLDQNSLLNSIKKSNAKKKIIMAGYNLKFDIGLNYIKKKLISKSIGKIYHCSISYANGTAKTNTNKIGSIFDMASHSINLIMWLFKSKNLKVLKSYNQYNEFSKKTSDNGYAIIKIKKILINLHHGFCNWKNNFRLEIHGSKGSLKVNSLPKWSEQTILLEKRTLPSGLPKIKIKRFNVDLSFRKELEYLLKNISNIKKLKLKKITELNYESFNTLKNSFLLK